MNQRSNTFRQGRLEPVRALGYFIAPGPSGQLIFSFDLYFCGPLRGTRPGPPTPPSRRSCIQGTIEVFSKLKLLKKKGHMLPEMVALLGLEEVLLHSLPKSRRDMALLPHGSHP